MTDKDNVSMATVQMKPDYAASEVYSTASEPPPAYKRQSNSVKIAKIAGFTIVVSSFILGTFILASSYLQAKASCDQVQALDSVLEKELMLETLQQVNKELPRAEALLGKEHIDDANLQHIDEPANKKVEMKGQEANPEEEGRDSSYSESDETEELQKYPGKMPLELDLSDLAAAILRNNKKSRMNCVVERKHAEEIVDSPSKTVALPFGVNLTTDPKKARITGERISIFCDGGDDKEEKESKRAREEDDDSDEDAEPLRPMFIPFQRVPIPFGRMPDQMPLTHMPQRMMPPAIQQQQLPQQGPIIIRQLPPPFQHLPMRPPMPPQVMHAPRMESQEQPQTVRIHVQQIPFRQIHMADDTPMQIPANQAPQQQMQQREMPQIQIQHMPLGMALQRVGITADDLRNIQRLAEDRITEELRRFAAEESSDSSENNSSSSSDEDEHSNVESTSVEHSEGTTPAQTQTTQPEHRESVEPQNREQQAPQLQVQRLILQPLPEQPRDTMSPPMPDQPQQLQFGRMVYGRSLAQPVRIPVPMMQPEGNPSAAHEESERPHFVHPRSV
ncbi:uncharacterized protein LOC115622719 isoform X2 [Scaptodrosophila lebanonensis]|uniref:Uncharacterized protein LOC115622719 isoform X2 n=1 Tax=Drosophila lebanonensis TaxID=7225 RepID=A0A6J2TB77_DROLE|nr:uncharacterized protein LOC115622719 isoform X2 [Scaptodrosophila lebanonensis]